MTIGELLKDYRIQQKKTQKEWAGNIISPSFYAKVEKKISRISAEDLVDLLHANKVPLIDFFGKLNYQDQSVHDENQEIDKMIDEAYFQDSVHDLQQVRNFVAESKFPNKEDKLNTIDILIAMLNKDLSSIDKNIIDKMKEKTFNISHFSSDNLNMYCNLMSFYDLDSNLVISKRLVKQFIGSSSIRIQKLVLAVIINMMILCIRNKRFEETEFFINSEQQIKTKPDVFFYKAIAPAFEDIIKYHFDQNKQYLDEVKGIAETIKIAGMPEYGKELEELINS
ncbi:helix-turn-helix domain-containing protein [Lactobacillus sp. ESL0677]|uniref:helix-turn-helix domain-containing protein n=1 Tax=Lactobacillus sp. ESL0677 TaxID=2983208 RepID=UPI0023F90F3C|nr:helix-turn-helix domain-containing protein [Lactobacillus sp. ESL0677]WEV36886.1 hypothetical protein OZX76_09125 [Lactobacillus sp. ESL0677]